MGYAFPILFKPSRWVEDSGVFSPYLWHARNDIILVAHDIPPVQDDNVFLRRGSMMVDQVQNLLFDMPRRHIQFWNCRENIIVCGLHLTSRRYRIEARILVPHCICKLQLLFNRNIRNLAPSYLPTIKYSTHRGITITKESSCKTMLLHLCSDFAEGIEMLVIVVMDFFHKPRDSVGSCVP